MYPDVAPGKHDLPSGCFTKVDVNSGQLFGWELVMTFVLVMTVFAVSSQLLFNLNTIRSSADFTVLYHSAHSLIAVMGP